MLALARLRKALRGARTRGVCMRVPACSREAGVIAPARPMPVSVATAALAIHTHPHLLTLSLLLHRQRGASCQLATTCASFSGFYDVIPI